MGVMCDDSDKAIKAGPGTQGLCWYTRLVPHFSKEERRSGRAQGDGAGSWAHNRNQKPFKIALHPCMQNKSQLSKKMYTRQWLKSPLWLCFLGLREKSSKQNLF